jgi:hypothetical protein
MKIDSAALSRIASFGHSTSRDTDQCCCEFVVRRFLTTVVRHARRIDYIHTIILLTKARASVNSKVR